MYVIIVYDVGVERVNKVKAFLRKYLNWVQNSVFEGEVTPYRLEVIKHGLSKIITPDDSVIIYMFRTKKEIKKKVLGTEKMPVDEVI